MSETIGKSEGTSSNTLAHEMIAREEQNIGLFFTAFAIQFYMSREMLRKKLNKPAFILFFGDMEIYASQRVLIKNIITSHHFKKVIEDMDFIFHEHNEKPDQLPHEIFLSRINKGFLIRQIFKQTDQILSKYHFIDKYVGKEISMLDLDELKKDMEAFPVEQQILVLARIFIQMKDNFENKKKSIHKSFIENIKRTKDEYSAKGKISSMEYENLKQFLIWFSDHN